MAVTYIRRIAGSNRRAGADGAPGADVNVRDDLRKGSIFPSECRNCQTRQTVRVGYSRVVVDVAGPTCRLCDPAAFDQREEPAHQSHGAADRPPERVFKVWLASQDRAAPRVEVRDIPADGQVARRVKCRPIGRAGLSQERGSISADRQRENWASDTEAKLGTGAWRVIHSAWKEEHCDIVAALGNALDQIWVIVRAGGSLVYRVIVRLEGLPAIVNVLLAEVAARSIAAHDGPPLHIMADHFRQVGVAACAATGSRECASLEATVERLAMATAPQPLTVAADAELVQRLIDELALPASWSGRSMLALDDAFRFLVTPAEQPARHIEPSPQRSRPEGRLEYTLELIRESRELNTVTRPLTFGDTRG